jgi:hypothetical protein
MTALGTLTLVHVALSLAGIVAGFAVLWGLLTGRRLDRWTGVFLATTVLTSATGFLFPFERFLPSHAFGILSLILLGVAVAARYRYQLAGGWRPAYVVTALMAFYLNFFVLVVQSFLKVPALKTLAPTQSEAPFLAAQLITLVLFVAWGALALVRFHPRQSLATA